VAGGVTPFASINANSTPVLNLDGTATGNEIHGVIADPTNAPAISNPLRLTKSNNSTWTLSGINTFSGTTTISAGTLVIDGGGKSQCLSDTNLLTISGGKLQLEAGVKEKVGSLMLGAAIQTNGIWGSSTSGATFTNDTYFAGTGWLYVGVDIPASGTLITIM